MAVPSNGIINCITNQMAMQGSAVYCAAVADGNLEWHSFGVEIVGEKKLARSCQMRLVGVDMFVCD